jgi:hypothetical protein
MKPTKQRRQLKTALQQGQGKTAIQGGLGLEKEQINGFVSHLSLPTTTATSRTKT